MTNTQYSTELNKLNAAINALKSKKRVQRQANIKRVHSSLYKVQVVEKAVDLAAGDITVEEFVDFINQYATYGK